MKPKLESTSESTALSSLAPILLAIALALLIGSISPLFSQNTGGLMPWISPVFLTANGSGPLANGFVCTYSAGTTTPLATYQDNAIATPNQNPIRLNSAGRPVNGASLVSVYLGVASYKFTSYAAGTGNTCNGTTVGALIQTVDNVYDIAELAAANFATKLDDKVCHASQYSGADAGAKIAACITALPSTGGTIDVRGLEGAQAWAACPFTGITKPLTVILQAGTTTLGASCTIPVTTTLERSQGSILSTSGVTLTLNGVLTGPTDKAFAGSTNPVLAPSLTPVIYAGWFGVLGDGTTDDQATINTALTVARGAGKLYFGPGTYRVTESLTIAGGVANLLIEGAGPRTRFLNAASANKPTFDLPGAQYVTMRSLAIIGQSANVNDAIYCRGVAPTGSGNCIELILDDVNLTPCGSGVHLLDANSITIRSMKYWADANANGGTCASASLLHAIYATGTFVNAVTIDGCHCNGYYQDWATTKLGSGISWNTPGLGNSQNLNIRHANLEASGAGTPGQAINLAGLFDVEISNNFLDHANVTISRSRRVTLISNRGGTGTTYNIGDNTAPNATASVIVLTSAGDTFIADQYTSGVGSINSVFDVGGYTNSGTCPIAINTQTTGSTYVAFSWGCEISSWTTPAFNAANFAASAGNWTVDAGDVTTYAYQLLPNKTMTLAVIVVNSDVSATPSDLKVVVPASKTITKTMYTSASYRDAGGSLDQRGACVATAATNSIIIRTFNEANWTMTAADNTAVYCTITFEFD